MSSMEEIKIEHDFWVIRLENETNQTEIFTKKIPLGLIQFHYNLKGKSKFEDAHDEGKKAQGKVDGTIIGENWVDDSFNKTGSGIVRTLFTRGGKLHTLEITVDKGNITGTSVKAGWVIPDGKGKGGTTTITSIPTK